MKCWFYNKINREKNIFFAWAALLFANCILLLLLLFTNIKNTRIIAFTSKIFFIMDLKSN